MNNSNWARYALLASLAALTIFACNALSNSTVPTATPPPPTEVVPTQEPEPTETLVPTETPTSVPTETPTALPTETNLPTSNTLDITMMNVYIDSYESLQVVGLVTNYTDRTVDNIEIEIQALDAADSVLYTETTYAELYNLGPGETSPFGLTIYEELADADHYTADIVGNSVSDVDLALLEVKNINLFIDETNDVHLVGELLNPNNSPVLINGLAGATFDESANIITENTYSVMVRYLDPEETTPFRITMYGPTDAASFIQDYEVYIDAEFTEPYSVFDLTFSDALNYLDYYDDLHLVGEVTNNGQLPLNIRLVAGIYDESGSVLDAASVDLPITAIQTGETAPFDFDFWGPVNYINALYDQAFQYSIQVDPYWTWEASTSLIDLSTAGDENTFDEYGGEFTGQVVNNTDASVENVIVVVYLRDIQSGEVTGTGYDYIFEAISKGETAQYTVYIDTPENFDINGAEYFIIVKGEQQ